MILPSPVQPIPPRLGRRTTPILRRRSRPPWPEERRDANDLARAAIERLRTGHGEPVRREAADAARQPSAAPYAAVVSAPALQPLPPPIMVSAPQTIPTIRDRSRQGRLMRPMPAPPTTAGRPRRLIFRRHGHSTCTPRRPSRPCGSTPRLPPKTCCPRRNRCSTPYCRNNPKTIATFEPSRSSQARPGFDPWGGAKKRVGENRN